MKLDSFTLTWIFRATAQSVWQSSFPRSPRFLLHIPFCKKIFVWKEKEQNPLLMLRCLSFEGKMISRQRMTFKKISSFSFTFLREKKASWTNRLSIFLSQKRKLVKITYFVISFSLSILVSIPYFRSALKRKGNKEDEQWIQRKLIFDFFLLSFLFVTLKNTTEHRCLNYGINWICCLLSKDMFRVSRRKLKIQWKKGD